MFDRKQAAELFRRLPEITTPRLLLRKFKRSDVREVFAYASDPQVTIYTPWEHHRELKTTRKFLDAILAAYRQGRPAPWAIVLREKDRLIGAIGVRNWAIEHARAEVGYVLAREHWGQGYASEALKAVLAFGFSRMDLNRIEAKCLPENKGSIRVLEKSGMRREGRLREVEFSKGKFEDLNLYSILRRDFREKQT